MIEIKILGTEFSADFLNPDFREFFEDEIYKAADKARNIDFKDKRASECIREQCNAVIDCFNNVFGEGSANKIFGASTDLMKCLDAFCELCNVQEKYIDPAVNQKLKDMNLFSIGSNEGLKTDD